MKPKKKYSIRFSGKFPIDLFKILLLPNNSWQIYEEVCPRLFQLIGYQQHILGLVYYLIFQYWFLPIDYSHCGIDKPQCQEFSCQNPITPAVNPILGIRSHYSKSILSIFFRLYINQLYLQFKEPYLYKLLLLEYLFITLSEDYQVILQYREIN